MPVKIFRAEIGRKKQKDMLVLEHEMNHFEKLLQERGMEIRSIALSSQGSEYALYSMVHYSSKTREEQGENKENESTTNQTS